MTANIDITTLRALNGTALKLYILLSDRPEGATAKQLADLLGVTERAVRKAISEWNESSATEQKFPKKEQKFRGWNESSAEKETKEKALFPHTPNLEKENKEKEDCFFSRTRGRRRRRRRRTEKN